MCLCHIVIGKSHIVSFLAVVHISGGKVPVSMRVLQMTAKTDAEK